MKLVDVLTAMLLHEHDEGQEWEDTATAEIEGPFAESTDDFFQMPARTAKRVLSQKYLNREVESIYAVGGTLRIYLIKGGDEQ